MLTIKLIALAALIVVLYIKRTPPRKNISWYDVDAERVFTNSTWHGKKT